MIMEFLMALMILLQLLQWLIKCHTKFVWTIIVNTAQLTLMMMICIIETKSCAIKGLIMNLQYYNGCCLFFLAKMEQRKEKDSYCSNNMKSISKPISINRLELITSIKIHPNCWQQELLSNGIIIVLLLNNNQ